MSNREGARYCPPLVCPADLGRPDRYALDKNLPLTLPSENPAPPRLTRFEIAALLLALVACRLLVISSFPIYDDAFITYRYAANLAQGLGLVFSPGMPWEPVLGTTTPGYAVVMSGFHALGLDLTTASRAFNLVCDLVTGLLLLNLFGRRRFAATASLFLFAALPPLARISMGGMESPLFLAMTLGAVMAFRAQRHTLAGVLAALACSVRPEAVLLVMVLAAQRPFERRTLMRYLVPVAVIGVVHVAVLLAIYGSPIPQSVLAKAGNTTEEIPWERMGQVLLHSFIPLSPLVVVLPLVLIGFARGLRRPAGAFLVFSLLIVFGYLFSGVKTWGWYYYVPLMGWVMGLTLGTEWLLGRAWSPMVVARSLLSSRLAPTILGLMAVCSVTCFSRLYPDTISGSVYGPLAAWAQTVGLEEQQATIAASDIGAIGYFSGAVILDTEGLVWPPAAEYEHQVEVVAHELPDYVLVTATRERVLRFVADPIRDQYRFVRRFNALEGEEGEPLTGLLVESWTQDYVLYARLDP